MTTKEPTKKIRSIEHQAASACVKLSTLDLSIARAKETLRDKTAERERLVKELPADVATLVARMRPAPEKAKAAAE
jgi:hypothetical protein